MAQVVNTFQFNLFLKYSYWYLEVPQIQKKNPDEPPAIYKHLGKNFAYEKKALDIKTEYQRCLYIPLNKVPKHWRQSHHRV